MGLQALSKSAPFGIGSELPVIRSELRRRRRSRYMIRRISPYLDGLRMSNEPLARQLPFNVESGTLMRLALISDIHDNLTALEAVLADLRETSPDLVLLGGDIVSGGSRPAEVVDRIRDLAWPGVLRQCG
jgi:predicted MPP superfamily phosphohydrolase